MNLVGVYPGSFDPVTNGHLDIIERAAKIVDKLIIGVLRNPSKKGLFTPAERVEQLKEVTKHIDNVEIVEFEGLLIDFVKQSKAKLIIRGLRAVTDFEYEFQWALTHNSLEPDIETVFLSTNAKYSYISSSGVKELASFGGNIDEMVPEYIAQQLKKKYSNI